MSIIKSLASKAINSENIFETWHKLLDAYHERPCHTVGELKEKNNKIKGDLFEEFCVLYLKNVKGYSNVYLFKDVPREMLTKLGFRYKGDFGIDIIVENNNEYYAVQSKYRSPNVNTYQHHRSDVITWREISTFYSLASRTGPWKKTIIMTTGSSIRRVAGRLDGDVSICKGTFQKMNLDTWCKCFEIEGHQIKEEEKPELDQVRQLRLKFFETGF